MESLSSFFESTAAFFSANPSVLFVQALMIGATFIVVFLVLFTLRDILLRTSSFLYQVFCILLVAALPVIGFLLYLLIRPSRTIAQRQLERKIDAFLQRSSGQHHKKQGQEGKKAKGQ